MKCPICKLEHKPAYAIKTVCVDTLRDHLRAAVGLLEIREEQIDEFLAQRKAIRELIAKWRAKYATNPARYETEHADDLEEVLNKEYEKE